MTALLDATPLPVRAILGLALAAGFAWLVWGGTRDLGRRG